MASEKDTGEEDNVAPRSGCRCVFGGMARVSDGRQRPPGSAGEPGSTDAIGAPSAGLSLGGLRARRARLRFTRRGNHTGKESVPARPRNWSHEFV